jgi:hypothetical protein
MRAVGFVKALAEVIVVEYWASRWKDEPQMAPQPLGTVCRKGDSDGIGWNESGDRSGSRPSPSASSPLGIRRADHERLDRRD